MRYNYHSPNTGIRDYVRSVLVLQDGDSEGSSDLPLVTTGGGLLLYRHGEQHSVTLYGMRAPDEAWEVNDGATVIAYFFKPFSLGTVFGISAQELKDKAIAFNQLRAQEAMALQMQLMHAPAIADKIAVLDNLVMQQTANNKRDCEVIRYATDQMMYNAGTEVLTDILKHLQLTERTFQRIFKKYVGTTPSHYRRICQFYFAFAQLRGGHYDKLTDVAYDNGYFDQSHYIRSFKEFTETTPQDYLEQGLKKKD